MKYQVYGDYGYVSQNLLEEFDSVTEAIRWAESYCSDDLGGYSVVEVAWFAADGEYMVDWARRADEYDDDGQPSEMEEWLDYDPDC